MIHGQDAHNSRAGGPCYCPPETISYPKRNKVHASAFVSGQRECEGTRPKVGHPPDGNTLDKKLFQ